MGRSGEDQRHPETVVPNVMFTTWTLFHWTIFCKKKHKPKLLITEETIGMAAGILYIHTVCTYSNDKTTCIAKGCLPNIWVC
jgi:hypothetical protein